MFGKINQVGFLSVFLFFMLISVSDNTYAQSSSLKDTDLDGISDIAELETYKTNPNSPDSDNDGVLDYIEILTDKTNPNDATSSKLITSENSSLSMMLNRDIPIMWYLSRISGIGAFIMFTMVISMGLLMTSKLILKVPFFKAPDALQIHSFNASVVAFSLMVLHFVVLMYDHFIQLSLYEILVPFSVERELKSALGFDLKFPIGLGVLAFYLAIVLVTTSQLRSKIVSVKTWRKVHYSSFLFYLLFLAHGILAGSDSTALWMQLIYVWSASLVTVLLLLRIFGKKYFIASARKASAYVTSSVATPTLGPTTQGLPYV